MTPFALTHKAKADLREIALHTEQRWGKEQRNHYIRQLDMAFHVLADNQLLGLVVGNTPRGDKVRLGRITKRGDVYLRTLLTHGTRAVPAASKDKQNQASQCLRELIERRGYKRATVALAAMNTRILWAARTGLSAEGDWLTARSIRAGRQTDHQQNGVPTESLQLQWMTTRVGPTDDAA